MIKQVVTILLLSLFFLQALPVKYLLAAEKSIAYNSADENKSDEGKSKEKKENKEYLAVQAAAINTPCQSAGYYITLEYFLPAPHLAAFTPPPDFTC